MFESGLGSNTTETSCEHANVDGSGKLEVPNADCEGCC